MYELYEYDGEGEQIIETFETREAMVQYMTEYELYAEYEDGYFGRCPDGEEITL